MDGFTPSHLISTCPGVKEKQDTRLWVPGTSRLGAGQANDFVGGSAGQNWFQSRTGPQICMFFISVYITPTTRWASFQGFTRLQSGNYCCIMSQSAKLRPRDIS